MAESPVRKRPVAGSRTVAGTPQKAVAARARRPAPMLEDDAPSENYALRLTEALEAIESAETGRPVRSRGAPTSANRSASVGRDSRKPGGNFSRWLQSLDKLPPIRLPIGPPIPWRLGLPMLLAIVAVTVVMSRPSAHADAQAVRLPTPEPYAVQQEAPLFTNAQAQAQAAAPATDAPVAPPALGVPESAGSGFDAADIAFKLIAVLALAYGCLLLLKRAGFGGATSAKIGGGTPVMRVVSSLALAPNRSVHVLKVPGGKTLLLGATPNQVNLIADLGDLPEEESPETTSFFDVLKGKIGN